MYLPLVKKAALSQQQTSQQQTNQAKNQRPKTTIQKSPVKVGKFYEFICSPCTMLHACNKQEKFLPPNTELEPATNDYIRDDPY
jgi:hypothetical protein